MNTKRYLFILICCLSLVACNNEKNLSEDVGSIEIEETIDFSKVKPNSLQTISNEEQILIIQKAVNRARKIDGIADIGVPQYKIKLNDTEYFLWINEDNTATIMNVKDTHTIYKIDSVKKLKEVISN